MGLRGRTEPTKRANQATLAPRAKGRARHRALFALAALLAPCGCEKEACERGRIELSSTWENLRETAVSRQQPPEGVELSEQVHKERLEAWTQIQERAELIRSSFSTKQITWSPAEKARAELDEWLAEVDNQEDPMVQGFTELLKEADQRFAHLKKTCR